MRALYLGTDGLRLDESYPEPHRQAGEALLRLRRAGVCSTDLELVKGYAGFRGVLGHEFVAEVEEADDPAWVGRRVVGSINLGCRSCRWCQGSGSEHCPTRTVLGIIAKDGAFAEQLTLPVVNLLEVPAEVSDRAAVFTEPLAAALRIREQVPLPPSGRVAVVGPGRLGLLIAQVLGLDGTRVDLLGRRPRTVPLLSAAELEVGVAQEREAASYDLVVEATGNEAGLAEALRLVRPRGTLVLKSTYQGAATVDLTPLVVNEVTVVGSRCGPFAPALRLLASGAIQVEPLIEAEYPLSEGLAALEHAARPGALKIQLRPS